MSAEPEPAALVRRLGFTSSLALAYAGIGLLYVCSRLLLLWRFPVHVDEATFATWTLQGHDQGGPALFQSLASGQQPMLPWLGAAVMELGVEPVTAIRLVSFVAGGLTVVLVAILATRIFGVWVGLAAAALYALAPFTVLYGALGLYDPLATFFLTAAMALQLEHARRPRLDLALLLGIALAGGVLTKLTAYAALYLLPLSALAFDWSREQRRLRLLKWLGGIAIALSLAFVASKVIALSELADDLPAARKLLAQNSIGEALDDPGRWFEQNWPAYRNVLAVYLTVPLLLASAIGAGLLLRRRPADGAFLVLWALIPLLGLLLLSEVPYGRWVLLVVPQLLVLAAYGLVETLRWIARFELQPRHSRALAAAVLFAASAPALWFDVGLLADPTGKRLPRVDDEAYLTGHAAGTLWSAVADWLRETAGPRPVVVAAAPSCCGVLPLELRDDAVTIVPAESADVPQALYGLENGLALPERADGLTWRRIRTFARPRGGTPVEAFESGVLLELDFASTPDELRRLVGGADADFDAFVAARPAVAAWLDAWYLANDS
jgi:4-amino-4-deoxy-L-arabinose transferase-like glycosyltransferase